MICLKVLAVVALGVLALPAQSEGDLPEFVCAEFGSGDLVADSFYLEPDGGGAVSVKLLFDTLGQSVTVRWGIADEGVARGNDEDVFETSFQPTAVCREAGNSSAFYVAGYSKRSGLTIVERWAIDDAEVHVVSAPVTDPPPQNPPPPKAILVKRVRRAVVLAEVGLAPFKAIAYNPVLNKIVAIDLGADWATGEGSGAFHIDPDTGYIEPISVLHGLDALRYHHSIHVVYSTSSGLSLVLDRRPVWLYSNTLLFDEGEQVVLIRDPTFSGSYANPIVDYTWTQFKNDGLWDGVVPRYQKHAP